MKIFELHEENDTTATFRQINDYKHNTNISVIVNKKNNTLQIIRKDFVLNNGISWYNHKNAPKETKWSSKYGHWEEKPIDLTYDMAMEIAAIAAAYINTNPYSDDELDE